MRYVSLKYVYCCVKYKYIELVKYWLNVKKREKKVRIYI